MPRSFPFSARCSVPLEASECGDPRPPDLTGLKKPEAVQVGGIHVILRLTKKHVAIWLAMFYPQRTYAGSACCCCRFTVAQLVAKTSPLAQDLSRGRQVCTST